MKLSILLLSSIFAVSAALQSCGNDAAPSKVNAAESNTGASGSSLDAKANEAMNSAKDAVAKGKDEWKKFADKELPELDKQITQLKDKAAQSSGAAKVELDKVMQEIGEKRKVLDAKLVELKAAGSEQWQSTKTDIHHALAELQKSIDQALEKSK